MAGHALSRSERRSLTAIERTLRTDPRFRRVMTVGAELLPDGRGTPERRAEPEEPRSRLPGAVWASVVLSLVLLPLAAATSSPTLICAFAVSYAITLVGIGLLLRHWCGRCG
ncbi:DUF3040 domain-containing protein [Streptomyces sp. NPDC012794]|uniref:DUF3040 domain-containing protein n=1 Tax=Streptomyces sp. NPDC012794 TaxID=3364850 RepID=UPI00368C1508